MTTRREFLKLSGAAVATTVLSPAQASGKELGNAGIQLWTVREELARDLDATLLTLRRLGYRQVEAAGWHGRSADQFRKAVSGAGLKLRSAHASLADLVTDTDRCLGFARDAGVTYIVASIPMPSRRLARGLEWSRAMAEAMMLADWRSNAEAMNRIGRVAREKGLRFAYHNHAAEFLEYEGRLPMEEIVRITDPSLVALEIDVGWVAAAGRDPVETIERYRSRVELAHIKDIRTRERTPGKMATDLQTVPIGQGTIDWPAVFKSLEASSLQAWFVEQEPPFARPAMDGVERSIGYLGSILA